MSSHVNDPKEGKNDQKLRGRVSSAHVIALAALFVALGGTAFAAATIGTNDIKNQAVTKPKIAKKAVTTGRIADQAVTDRTLRDQAVTNPKLADNSVDSPRSPTRRSPRRSSGARRRW